MLRISLRMVFVVLTALCVILAIEVRKAERQKVAVAWVEEMGGSVAYDHEVNKDGEWMIDPVPPERPGPNWLRDLIGVDYFETVVTVGFLDRDMTDLSPLGNLPQLRVLHVNGGHIHSPELTPLANLTELKTLDLSGTHVSDVSPLANLTNLEDLDLSHTHVNGLLPLAILTNLKTLGLQDITISNEEIATLQSALPNCMMVRTGSVSALPIILTPLRNED